MNLVIFKLFLFQFDFMIEKNCFFFREKIINYALPISYNTTKNNFKLMNFV